MEAKKKSKYVTYEQKQLLSDFVHMRSKLNIKQFEPFQFIWYYIIDILSQQILLKKLGFFKIKYSYLNI